jgi:hypothetical protein
MKPGRTLERWSGTNSRTGRQVLMLLTKELSLFAFVIGKRSGEAMLKWEDGSWESFKATWEGRYIFDSYAIADEYRITTPAGELLVLGMNLRSYDAKNRTWNLKWLDALAGTGQTWHQKSWAASRWMKKRLRTK